MSSKVLVTGATGMLGRHVVAALEARGHNVRLLARPSRRGSGAAAEGEFAYADLRRSDGIAEALVGVDVVVHLAACVVGDDETQFASTVVGTENLLTALRASGVKRLVHCSTYSVYDWKTAGRELSESTPLEANLYDRDGYAITKSWQERLVSRFAEESDCEVVILRPGFIWGPGRQEIAGVGHDMGRLNFVIGWGRRLPVTYVENCAEGFALAVDHPRAPGETLNIVDDEQPTAWEFAGRCRRLSEQSTWRLMTPYWLGMAGAHVATRFSKAIYAGKGKLPGILVPAKFRARFRPLRFANDRVKDVLGWKPRYGLDEAWQRSLLEAAALPRPADHPESGSASHDAREATVV